MHSFIYHKYFTMLMFLKTATTNVNWKNKFLKFKFFLG